MKSLVYCIILCLFSSFVWASNTVTYGGIFYNDGLLTVPDSIRVEMVFSPSGLDTSFLSVPDSAIWDTSVVITTQTDEEVKLTYRIVWGSDVYYVEEKQLLRYSSNDFTSGYFHSIAESSDSGLSTSDIGLIADSTRKLVEQAGGFLWSLRTFWGSAHKMRQIYFPDDGTATKDSVQIQDSLGVVLMTIQYKHTNNANVLDSAVILHRLP